MGLSYASSIPNSARIGCNKKIFINKIWYIQILIKFLCQILLPWEIKTNLRRKMKLRSQLYQSSYIHALHHVYG